MVLPHLPHFWARWQLRTDVTFKVAYFLITGRVSHPIAQHPPIAEQFFYI